MVHDSMQALLQGGAAEVDQKSDLAIGQAKIREQLLAVDWSKGLNGLNLHDDRSIDEQIKTKPFVENNSVVFKADWFLPLDLKPASRKKTSNRDDRASNVVQLMHDHSKGSRGDRGLFLRISAPPRDNNPSDRMDHRAKLHRVEKHPQNLLGMEDPATGRSSLDYRTQ
jgi:hypothetical protein